ncbi:MAG: iron chaperone [Gemmatimonadaceae bacterium]
MKPSDRELKSKVQTYFAASPADARRALKRLRELIRAAAPGATETWSYSIPAFRLDGKILVWYARWKNHTSLYPLVGEVRRVNAAELAKYDTSKGTIRFPLNKPIPAGLVKKIVKGRAAEIRRKSKPGPSRSAKSRP